MASEWLAHPWLEFLRKFRRDVRGSGKIKVGDKRWFVSNMEREGWQKGRLLSPLRKLMQRFDILLSFYSWRGDLVTVEWRVSCCGLPGGDIKLSHLHRFSNIVK